MAYDTEFFRSRCSSCNAFVSVKPFIELRSDFIFCRCCGASFHMPDFALVAGSRRAETRPYEAQGKASQNGPKGNAHISVLLLNGKYSKRQKRFQNFEQRELFGGAA